MSYKIITNSYDDQPTFVYNIRGKKWVTNGCQTFPEQELEQKAEDFKASEEVVAEIKEALQTLAPGDMTVDDLDSMFDDLGGWRRKPYIRVVLFGMFRSFAKHGMDIEYIEYAFINYCSYSVDQKGRSLLWENMVRTEPVLALRIPEKLNPKKLLVKAFKKGGFSLDHLPEELWTESLAKMYAGWSDHALRYIPVDLITVNVVKRAVKQTRDAIGPLTGVQRVKAREALGELLKAKAQKAAFNLRESSTGGALMELKKEEIEEIARAAAKQFAFFLSGGNRNLLD